MKLKQIEHLTALVVELQSKEYTKGFFNLHTEFSGQHFYCVQGVACELYRQRENTFNWTTTLRGDLEIYYGIPTKHGRMIQEYPFIQTQYMPDFIMNWYGLSEDDCNKLMRINDKSLNRKDFNDEADFLLEVIKRISIRMEEDLLEIIK